MQCQHAQSDQHKYHLNNQIRFLENYESRNPQNNEYVIPKQYYYGTPQNYEHNTQRDFDNLGTGPMNNISAERVQTKQPWTYSEMIYGRGRRDFSPWIRNIKKSFSLSPWTRWKPGTQMYTAQSKRAFNKEFPGFGLIGKRSGNNQLEEEFTGFGLVGKRSGLGHPLHKRFLTKSAWNYLVDPKEKAKKKQYHLVFSQSKHSLKDQAASNGHGKAMILYSE